MGSVWRRAKRIVRAKIAGLGLEPGDATSGVCFDPEWEASGGAAEEPPAAPDDERSRALALLELQSPATREEIRSAYRQLCRRYHPDRFDGDEKKSRAAHELLVRINAAYALLTAERPTIRKEG